MSIEPKTWREPFLAALQSSGTIAEACRRVGVKYKTFYRAREDDRLFAAQCAAALGAAPPKKRDTWRDEFLEELRQTGKITLAAERAGVRRETVSRARRADAEFERQCRTALEPHDWKPRFLREFAACGRYDIAARLANVAPRTVRERRRTDPLFDADYHIAEDVFDGEHADEQDERERRWKTAFLQALERAGSVQAACDRTHITAAKAYRMRDRDPFFAKHWDDALGIAADELTDEAISRAGRYDLRKLMWLRQRYGHYPAPRKYDPLQFTEMQQRAMTAEERAAVELLRKADWMKPGWEEEG